MPPVDDHPVHEKTKISEDWRYGCNNHAPRKEAIYYAPNRVYDDDGKFTVELKDIKTEWLEYDVCPAKHDHQGCTDCPHARL